jgi:hypothetical protein
MNQRIERLKLLPIGAQYQMLKTSPQAHDARFDDYSIVWTKTGKTTSKCSPNQRIGTRHDNRLKVQIILNEPAV